MNCKTCKMEETKHTPEKEFNNYLKQVGDLYEEGKDCLYNISVLHGEDLDKHRLFEILKQARDLTAISLKENKKLKESNRELIEALKGMVETAKRFDPGQSILSMAIYNAKAALKNQN